jgi:hypothetical protein
MSTIETLETKAQLRATREIISAVQDEITKAKNAGLSDVILYAAELIQYHAQKTDLGGGYCDRPSIDDVLAQSGAWVEMLNAKLRRLDSDMKDAA